MVQVGSSVLAAVAPAAFVAAVLAAFADEAAVEFVGAEEVMAAVSKLVAFAATHCCDIPGLC